RRGELQVLRLRDLVNGNELLRVLVLDHDRKTQIGASGFLEHAYSAQLRLEAVLLAADRVVRRLETLEAEANLDVRVAFDDRHEPLRMQPVRADLGNSGFRIENVDDLAEIPAQRRLPSRDIQVVEAARQLRQGLDRDLFFLDRGVLPDVAHLAPRVAPISRDHRQVHSLDSYSDDRSGGTLPRPRLVRSLEHGAIKLEQRVDMPLHRELPLGTPAGGGAVAPSQPRVLHQRLEAPRQRVSIAGGEQQAGLAVHDQLRDAADVARDDGLAVRHGLEDDERAVLVPLRRDDEKRGAAYRLIERRSRDVTDELRVRVALAYLVLERPGPRDAQRHAIADGRMGFEQRDDSLLRGEPAEKE